MKRKKTDIAQLPPEPTFARAEQDNMNQKNATVKHVAPRPIASLGIRIVLGIATGVLILSAGVILANLKAIDTYNQATTSLTASIEYAKNPDADQQQLKARLEQAKAQFDQAERLHILLPASIHKTIDLNRQIAQKHITGTEHKIAKAQSANNSDSQNPGTDAQLSPSGQAGDTGLTEEQRKQVEDVLKANTRNGGVEDSKKSQANNEKNANVKPW